MGGTNFFVLLGLSVVAMVGIMFAGYVLLLRLFLKRAKPGQALVRTGVGPARVSFGAIFAFPVLHLCSVVDITVKQFGITEKFETRDKKSIYLGVSFSVRINNTAEDVRMVAGNLGPERTFDETWIKEHFRKAFREAMVIVVQTHDADELLEDWECTKTEILEKIGAYLNGYVLDDAVIDEMRLV
jgi:uncharacterized membrane protein YqiK